MKIVINDAYQKLWETDCRYRIFLGGSSGGKSFGLTQVLLLMFIRIPYFNLLACRKIATSTRDSLFPGFIQIIDELEINDMVSINQTKMEINCHSNSNVIKFRGIQGARERAKIKSIKGYNGPISSIFLDEATEFEPPDVAELDRRLRGDIRQKNSLSPFFTMALNPESDRHWIKKEYDLNDDSQLNAVSSNPEVFVLRTTWKDNIYADPKAVAAMARTKNDPERANDYLVYYQG
ncbi:MAG: hypothetical protein GY757_10170, partial [bacterium]|nr:hypothetical protein [bacterium]